MGFLCVYSAKTVLTDLYLPVDPDTSIPFPASITPIGSSSTDELKLIGLGVRTV